MWAKRMLFPDVVEQEKVLKDEISKEGNGNKRYVRASLANGANAKATELKFPAANSWS